MKKQKFKQIMVAGLLAWTMVSPASAKLNGDGDFQYWDITSFEGRVNDRWKASMDAEFRFGNDVSKLYYQEDILALNYKVNDWFEIGPGYLQAFQLSSKVGEENDWIAEYRPIINATVKMKWQGWDLSSRSRFEYRIFEDSGNDVFRYRNRFTFKSPWKWTTFHINPYLADEIFVQDGIGFQTNRLYLGVGIDLIAHVKGDLFYLWQITDKAGDWMDLNVFGTKLKFEF